MRLDRNVALFLAVLFLLTVANIARPHRPTFSELEKRPLRTLPAFTPDRLWSGAYFQELEEYFADTFLFRDAFVHLAHRLKGLKGLPAPGEAELVLAAGGSDLDGSAGAPAAPPPEPGASQPQLAAAGEQPAAAGAPTAAVGAPEAGAGAPSGDSQAAIALGPRFRQADMAEHRDLRRLTRTPAGGAETRPQPAAAPAAAQPPTPQPAAAPAAAKPPTPEPAAEDPSERLYRHSSILVLKDRGYELYSFSPAAAEGYAAAINRLAAGLPEGVRVYVLLVPIPIEFIDSDRYRGLADSQREAIQYVYDRLDPQIIRVDGYSALRDHADEYVYFRTDHHWTALGAYHAYTAFIAAAGGEPVPLSQYDVQEVPGFLGSLYTRTLNKRLERAPDTVQIFRPRVQAEYSMYWDSRTPSRASLFNMSQARTPHHKYRVFLGGDPPLGRIVTEVKNGRRIAVIKDSYANAFVPFLVSHYEEIWVVDPRHFQRNILQFLREHTVTDVLFLNYTLVTMWDTYGPLINAMMDR